MPYESQDNLWARLVRKYRPDAPPPRPAENWDRTFGRSHVVPFVLCLFVLVVLILCLTLCSMPMAPPPPGDVVTAP
jgi:hypothetical protein